MVIPVARGLLLAEHHIGYSDGKVDLYGIFTTIRARSKFPYTTAPFCVFATLANGLGQIPCFVDIRCARSNELVWTSQTRHLQFGDRLKVVQFATTIEGCQFKEPGGHLIELYCDNTFVCDSPFQVTL